MNMLAVLLALSPVIVIFLLLVLRRTPADLAGVVGWICTVLVAWLYFQTPLSVALRASLSGIVASLPIALVVATSIFQVTIMIETGAIARVVALIKSVAPGDQVVQIMLINVGFGTLLTALGAVPVSILPPDQYLAIVVQATHGCTWNRCTFCNFYQDRPFEIRSTAAFADHLRRVADLLGRAASMRRSLFLADGNALALSVDRLRPIVDAARAAFPDRPWSGFVDVFTGERKTADDWRELRAHGLDRVYVGLETGHGPLLEFLNKPGTPEDARSFLTTLKEAGVRVSVILMAGAGGERYAAGHVRDTLAVVGGLPLGPGDLVYLSPFVEHTDSEYASRAREDGVRPLADAARARDGAGRLLYLPPQVRREFRHRLIRNPNPTLTETVLRRLDPHRTFARRPPKAASGVRS